MNVAETRSPMSESECRLRAALADTHLETPRKMAGLDMPDLLGKLFDATLLSNLRPSAVLLPLIRRGERLSMLRSEEQTSELQSLMRISYAVYCLKKNTYNDNTQNNP